MNLAGFVDYTDSVDPAGYNSADLAVLNLGLSGLTAGYVAGFAAVVAQHSVGLPARHQVVGSGGEYPDPVCSGYYFPVVSVSQSVLAGFANVVDFPDFDCSYYSCLTSCV